MKKPTILNYFRKYSKHFFYLLIILILLVFFVNTLIKNNNLAKDREIWYIRAISFQGLAGIDGIEPQHIHVDWKIYVNNQLIDYYKEQYLEKNRIVHMHPGKNNEWVTHVHNKGITLRHFLTTLGIKANQKCITINETSYCEDNNKRLRYYVNGKINALAPDYLIEDLDKILITYGNQSEAQIKSQLASIGNNACVQSNKCQLK